MTVNTTDNQKVEVGITDTGNIYISTEDHIITLDLHSADLLRDFLGVAIEEQCRYQSLFNGLLP